MTADPKWYCSVCGAEQVSGRAIERCWHCGTSFIDGKGATLSEVRPAGLSTVPLPASASVVEQDSRTSSPQRELVNLPGRAVFFLAIPSGIAAVALLGQAAGGAAGVFVGILLPFFVLGLALASAIFMAILVPFFQAQRQAGSFNPATSAAIAAAPFSLLFLLPLVFDFWGVVENARDYLQALSYLLLPLGIGFAFALATMPKEAEAKSSQVDRGVAYFYAVIALILTIFFLGFADLSKAGDLSAQQCEKHGSWNGRDVKPVESLLFREMIWEQPRGQEGLAVIVDLLARRNLAFVEVERRTRQQGERKDFESHFAEHQLPGNEGLQFLRFSLQPSGDMRCKLAEGLKDRPDGKPHSPFFGDAIPQGKCLAIELTNVPQAAVEFNRVAAHLNPFGSPSGSGRWLRYKDRASGTVLGEVWTGTGCFRKEEHRKLHAAVRHS